MKHTCGGGEAARTVEDMIDNKRPMMKINGAANLRPAERKQMTKLTKG
jgi:hypothetical protein